MGDRSTLERLLERGTSTERARFLLDTLDVDPALLAPHGEDVVRAVLAEALALVLFEELLTRVPDAKTYVDECRRAGRRVTLDHGALRTVLTEENGALPPGEAAFTRILLPLGYACAGVYPLERLRMTGRAYAHEDRPEAIAQYFVSELHPERFSERFEKATRNVVRSSRDPLDDRANADLATLAKERTLPFERAASLLPALAACFARQHAIPALPDYEALLAESPEMAWIATEGNAFNHATDRVDDVEALAARERAKGRPMKERVEVGSGGRVRQTAYRAAPVKRPFSLGEKLVEREVPGSFFEFITRDAIGEGDARRLDLSFDVGNATGIFAMTQATVDDAALTPVETLVKRSLAPADEALTALEACGVFPDDLEGGGELVARSPIDGATILTLPVTDRAAIDAAIQGADEAFRAFRSVPAPKRGDLVRRFGDLVREHREALATLVTVESGKIRAEARGEVQEVIDIADFAVGLSRQLHGLTIASERPDHRLAESWHPLGPCAVITAFNFPIAVFAWNAVLALVCGDPVIWKPSERTPLSALALHALLRRALRESSADERLASLVLGRADEARVLVDDPRIRLVSATGSTRMGRDVAARVAPSFRRTLLELGGNNAAIVTKSADLDLAERAITFAAVGTAGQRCTTLRRLFVDRTELAALERRLASIYGSLAIGDPRAEGTLVGPLVSHEALGAMHGALDEARTLGATILGGERTLEDRFPDAAYVRPAIVRMPSQTGPMLRETFAPILYLVPYDSLEEAIALHNATSHGLSSSIFTNDLREAELFLSSRGSDCGIANVNVGTSGAEIGGAFGGEKDTGGGRESGSDAWKNYMRRATNTIHYGSELPLAQGVRFEISSRERTP